MVFNLVVPDHFKKYPAGYVYRDGLPFSSKLAENLEDLKARVALDKAAAIIIDGGIGEGKTTLAAQVGDYLNGGPIDFSKQLAMGGADFMKKAEAVFNDKLHVLIYDEAGDFNRRGAITKFNQALNRFFETYRAYHIIVICCLPDFSKVDSYIFDNKIPRLLLHVHGRTRSDGDFKGYGYVGMCRILNHFNHRNKRLFIREQAFKWVPPNFYGHFKNLPPERSAALAEVSTSNKLKTLQTSRLKLSGLVSIYDLIQALGMSHSWVYSKLRKLKFNPVEKAGGKMYYSEEALKSLRNLKKQLEKEAKK